ELQEWLVAWHPAFPPYRHSLAQIYSSLGLMLGESGRHDEAQGSLDRALELQERVLAEVPENAEYQVGLAAVWINLGHVANCRGRGEEGLPSFARAISLPAALPQDDLDPLPVRLYLNRAHWRRAEALADMGRPADALADWDRAVELSPVQEKAG